MSAIETSNLTQQQQEVANYLNDNHVTERLNAYVKQLCIERPSDPFVYLQKAIASEFSPAITAVHARQIFDSRGNPTIEVEVTTAFGTDRAAVPSGASTGEYEALELRDKVKSEYMGKSVFTAVKRVNETIAPLVIGLDCTEQRRIDQLMIESDGSTGPWGCPKSNYGANAILGVSLAVARAGARAKNVPLYKHLQTIANKDGQVVLPVPSFNILNGGEHAGNQLAFQEFMIMPVGASSFTEAMKMGSEVYHTLKDVIKKKYGQDAVNVGDEGGFAPNITGAEDGLELVTEAIAKAGYTGKVKIAIDSAASEFYKDGKYNLDYKQSEPRAEMEKTGPEMIAYMEGLLNKYDIISLEDPFSQDDWETYVQAQAEIGGKVQLVGDDLLVTNPKRIQKALDLKACNALLLKVNQIGTLTESIDAVVQAQKAGWSVMTSHRSGETEDSFIADLAVGLCTGQIKTGAPARSERLAKYNQLLRIEEELGADAVYAGTFFRTPLEALSKSSQ